MLYLYKNENKTKKRVSKCKKKKSSTYYQGQIHIPKEQEFDLLNWLNSNPQYHLILPRDFPLHCPV